MIQVLVVEDSRITRDAIESQIAKSERYVLYASIENAANAEIACLRGSVDLILMDVCTADEESGLKAAAKIKQYNPKIKIIIMTSMPEHSFIQKAKACGCNGFWYKAVSYTHLSSGEFSGTAIPSTFNIYSISVRRDSIISSFTFSKPLS